MCRDGVQISDDEEEAAPMGQIQRSMPENHEDKAALAKQSAMRGGTTDLDRDVTALGYQKSYERLCKKWNLVVPLVNPNLNAPSKAKANQEEDGLEAPAEEAPAEEEVALVAQGKGRPKRSTAAVAAVPRQAPASKKPKRGSSNGAADEAPRGYSLMRYKATGAVGIRAKGGRQVAQVTGLGELNVEIATQLQNELNAGDVTAEGAKARMSQLKALHMTAK